MRPLRSLMLGDCDHYLSPYIFGVAQGMARLGHWHSQVSIRQPIDVIERRIADVRPDVLWTHMLLWPPPGAPTVERLVGVMELAHRAGARVIIHDGDYKPATRHPHDISAWCSLALLNHAFDRSWWRVPTLRWPYFAFAQDRIANPDASLACDLFFAGTTGASPVYAARTKLIEAVRRRGVKLRQPDDGNTLLRTAEIAASAGAVLGFGRPGTSGWVDTRVFQYAGAGGILLHDDVAGYLEPWVHFVPYRSGDVDSIVEALARLRRLDAAERRAIRETAFTHVQTHHSSVPRVAQVLTALELQLSSRRA
jgi:hypothetical protein